MELSKNTMTDEEIKKVLMEVDYKKDNTGAELLTAAARGYGLKEVLDKMPRKTQPNAEKSE